MKLKAFNHIFIFSHSSLPRLRQLCLFCHFSELKEAVEYVLPSLVEQGVTVLLMDKQCDTPGIHSFSDKVDEASDAPLPRSLRSHITFKSPALYIYTSGTTGTRVAALVHLVCQSEGIIISLVLICAVFAFLCFRSSQSSCGQSESPLNGSGCFIFKWCDSEWCHLPQPAAVSHSWIYDWLCWLHWDRWDDWGAA